MSENKKEIWRLALQPRSLDAGYAFRAQILFFFDYNGLPIAILELLARRSTAAKKSSLEERDKIYTASWGIYSPDLPCRKIVQRSS